jgi:ribosome-associated heat shock protein Hsp15
VRVNRDKVESASRTIRPGDVLTIALESGVKVLRVEAPGARRGPATAARLLYVDLSPPAAPRADRSASGGPRPTKRGRRTYDAERQSALGRDIFSRDDDGRGN